MGCFNGKDLGFAEEDSFDSTVAAEVAAVLKPQESELEFLARRAMEESRSAKQASTPAAAAAHSYLAAAYSAAISKELAKQGEFEELLLRIP